MATFRCAMFWQQSNTRTGGWTENFWNNASSQDVAKGRTLALVQALNDFKGNPVFCPRYRVGQYGATRLAQTYRTGFAADSDVAPSVEADYPTTKVQWKQTGQAPQFTTQWIGGIRDAAAKGGGFWQPSGAVTAKFQAVRALLRDPSNGWGVFVLDPAVLPVIIASIDAATGTVTTAAPHALVTGDIVRISRIHGINGINGVWQVVLVNATQVTLIGWKSSTDIMTRSPKGSIRKQSRVLQQISEVEIIQVTSHRVGKPTGLLGGRRKRPSSSLAGPLVAK